MPTTSHDRAGKAADAAYAAIADGHRKDWAKYGPTGMTTCACGRTFTTPNGLGLHLGHTDRKAWRAWEGAYLAAMAEARKEVAK